MYDNSEGKKCVLMASMPNTALFSGQIQYKFSGNSIQIFSSMNGSAALVPSEVVSDYYCLHLMNGEVSQVESSIVGEKYPVCLRYISPDIAVVERPPFRVKVRMSYKRSYYRRKKSRSVESDMEIWIPWTVAVLNLKNIRASLGGRSGRRNQHYYDSNSSHTFSLYFAPSSISSFDDELFPAYTPNVYGDGNVCMGTSVADGWAGGNSGKSDDQASVMSIYNYYMNEYFAGGWNLDLSHNIWFRNYLGLLPQIFDVPGMAKKTNNSYFLKNKFVYSKSDDAYYAFDRMSQQRSLDGSSYYKLYMNILSMLDLDQTLLYVRELIGRRRKGDSFTLDNILSSVDVYHPKYFSKLNSGGRTEFYDLKETGDFIGLYNYVLSSGKNKLDAHTWSLCIEYSVDDFREYFMSLLDGDAYNYRYYVIRGGSRKSTESHIRTVKTALLENDWETVERNFNVYPIVSQYHSDLQSRFRNETVRKSICEAVHKAVLEIRNTYYEKGADSPYKITKSIDARKIGIVRKSKYAEEGVLL
jgi:hypothetical protein